MDANTMFEELKVPIFDYENYSYWSIKMKHLLKEKGLWEII